MTLTREFPQVLNTDRITVMKSDGTVLGETFATVTPGLIVIKNVAPTIEEGDRIVRMRGDGRDEVYRVVEAVYYAGTGAHYQLRVEQQSA